MKSICLSLAAAATIGLALTVPVTDAVASGHARGPGPAAVAPPRVVVPNRNVLLPPKPTTRKRATTLAQIPASIRARLRPVISKIAAGRGRPAAGPQDPLEMDLTCGDDWLVTWEEDENGKEVPGTTEVSCGEGIEDLPIPD